MCKQSLLLITPCRATPLRRPAPHHRHLSTTRQVHTVSCTSAGSACCRSLPHEIHQIGVIRELCASSVQLSVNKKKRKNIYTPVSRSCFVPLSRTVNRERIATQLHTCVAHVQPHKKAPPHSVLLSQRLFTQKYSRLSAHCT